MTILERASGAQGQARPTLEEYARRALRDAAAARRRSLERKLGGELLRKYLRVVPSVFGAEGEFAAFRLLLPPGEALDFLKDRVVLALDSALELLAGFRFSAARAAFAYAGAREEIERIERERIGARLSGSSSFLLWVPSAWDALFLSVPPEMPPSVERRGFRVVEPGFLIRELLGRYGLRLDLVARIEAGLVRPYGIALPPLRLGACR